MANKKKNSKKGKHAKAMKKNDAVANKPFKTEKVKVNFDEVVYKPLSDDEKSEVRKARDKERSEIRKMFMGYLYFHHKDTENPTFTWLTNAMSEEQLGLGVLVSDYDRLSKTFERYRKYADDLSLERSVFTNETSRNTLAMLDKLFIFWRANAPYMSWRTYITYLKKYANKMDFPKPNGTWTKGMYKEFNENFMENIKCPNFVTRYKLETGMELWRQEILFREAEKKFYGSNESEDE